MGLIQTNILAWHLFKSYATFRLVNQFQKTQVVRKASLYNMSYCRLKSSLTFFREHFFYYSTGAKQWQVCHIEPPEEI
jgi:hypothetical protein